MTKSLNRNSIYQVLRASSLKLVILMANREMHMTCWIVDPPCTRLSTDFEQIPKKAHRIIWIGWSSHRRSNGPQQKRRRKQHVHFLKWVCAESPAQKKMDKAMVYWVAMCYKIRNKRFACCWHTSMMFCAIFHGILDSMWGRFKKEDGLAQRKIDRTMLRRKSQCHVARNACRLGQVPLAPFIQLLVTSGFLSFGFSINHLGSSVKPLGTFMGQVCIE